MKNLLFILMLLVVISGCTKIDYIGEEYPPTTNVNIYFSEDDVDRDYKVMGHLIATADDFVGAEKMQKDIIKKAREKGADGVVILGMDRYLAGGSSSFTETTKTEEKEDGTKTTTTGTSSSNTDEKKEIKAIFIKYN